MSVESPEFLLHFYEFWTIAVGISFLVKQKIKKEQRPDVPPEDLEIHHINPHFLGGNGDRENLMAVTKVEHALEHYQSAMSSSGDESRGHWWSVQKIIQRMSPEEVETFNKSIKKRR